MASDADVWWSVMGNYAPLKPYLEHLGINASSIRQIHDSWRSGILRGDPALESVLGGNRNLLNQSKALTYFQSQYPEVNQSMQTITTTANPINSNFSNEEFNKLVSQFNLDIAQQMATVTTIGRHTYGYWRKYAPSFAVNMGDSVADLIANQRSIELSSITIPEAAAISEPEIQPITQPILTDGKWSGWVTKPSGKVEQITLTLSTMQRLINEGWIFTTEKPPEPQPENHNVSIVFYIGKGGDLKTHFGINSIIITPDEAKNLADWLSQNYNTKILLVTNRLTNEVRSHTLHQIKDLIVQKLKDDQPDSPDITDDDTKKPQELGFMGAGLVGAIAGLILIGFIADHRGGK